MSQTDKISAILKDGLPHSNVEIHEATGLYRYSARIYELIHKRGVKIKGWRDEGTPSLYWYQIEREYKQLTLV